MELLDNFNFVLDNEKEFDTTYQMLLFQMNADNDNSSVSSSIHYAADSLSTCKVSFCGMVQRNNRDRISKHSMTPSVYFGQKEESSVVILQLLDKIHVYFLHSEHLKFNKTESEYIFHSRHSAISASSTKSVLITTGTTAADLSNSAVADMDPMLRRLHEVIERKFQFNKSANTSSRYHDLRYITRIKRDEEIQDDQKENSLMERPSSQFPDIADCEAIQRLYSGAQHQAFTFGKRWRYSKKYQNNEGVDKMNSGHYGEWFVPQRYKNLEREMLSNSLKQIPKLQWDHIRHKASQFMKCRSIRALQSCKTIRYEFGDSISNISQNDPIGLEHIICVLIYCNLTEIKNSLTDTYAPMNKFEQWKDVRAKHAGFVLI